MSARIKPGDRVRVVNSFPHAMREGDTGSVTDCRGPVVDYRGDNGRMVYGVRSDRFEKVEPEWVVGQQVSGDDYARLPVGSVVTLRRAGRPGDGDSLTKADETGWDDGRGDGYISNEGLSVARTLTHLPDAPEPEDTDDVEPEPLKVGDAVLVWATVDHVFSDGTPRVDIHNRTSAPPALTIVEPDAIVRPAEGQVPPWVQVATERVAMIAKTLMSEGGMDHDAAFKTAESLDRAGVRVAEGGAS